jgi:membrane-associated phospholipid phosphatase
MSWNMKAGTIATLLTLGLAACVDSATAPETLSAPSDQAASRSAEQSDVHSAARPTKSNTTTDWNERATSLEARRPAAPVFRLYAYLALAQLRAAEDARADRRHHPSTSAAIASASAAILTSFFPLDKIEIDNALAAQRSAEPTGRAKHEDFAAGETIGRAAAARVLAYAAGDRVGLANPGLPPTSAGHWFGTNPIRGGYKARPFYLKSDNEVAPPAPPVFGSAEFNEALAEVRHIADTRTPEQTAIANYWAVNQSAAIDAAMNNLAVELIHSHHGNEVQSARILFRMASAAFDAAIGCYNAKYDWWYIRPKQADPGIVTVFNAPNHPSYPSGHSCHSGASTGVLAAEFPDEAQRLADIATEASLSRLYAGIHYRFDMVAGLALGRKVAAKAMAANLDKVAVR